MSLPAINESNIVSPTAVVVPKARLWIGRVLLWLFFAFMSMDTVIHLAGENLFGKRWSARQKHVLRSSRTEPTTTLSRLVAARKPSCFISASAVAYLPPWLPMRRAPAPVALKSARG